jgi:hypothetical protein
MTKPCTNGCVVKMGAHDLRASPVGPTQKNRGCSFNPHYQENSKTNPHYQENSKILVADANRSDVCDDPFQAQIWAENESAHTHVPLLLQWHTSRSPPRSHPSPGDTTVPWRRRLPRSSSLPVPPFGSLLARGHNSCQFPHAHFPAPGSYSPSVASTLPTRMTPKTCSAICAKDSGHWHIRVVNRLTSPSRSSFSIRTSSTHHRAMMGRTPLPTSWLSPPPSSMSTQRSTDMFTGA